MAKGYWIAHVDVSDPEGYKEYQVANAVAFRKYGGRFLARAGVSELPEGKLRSRHVIIEFKDYSTALACYHSPEYAVAKEKRKGKKAKAIWTSPLSRAMTVCSRGKVVTLGACCCFRFWPVEEVACKAGYGSLQP